MSTTEITQWPRTAEREATIQLSDTFSDTPAPDGAPPIADFDSLLTAQVRNCGYFSDLESPIGAWPDTGNYGAVLLSELRQEQRRMYGVYEALHKTDLPDAVAIKNSLEKVVVGVINWAPRTDKHRRENQNGEHFYLTELDDNIQLFSQLRFLEGVAARGLVRALWRIPDDNPLWPKGEQFRSSIVSQIRNFPECLIPQDLSILSKRKDDYIRNVFSDKYGNIRLEVPAKAKLAEITKEVHYRLTVAGVELEEDVVGATKLTDIGENQLGLYANPADSDEPDSPRYVELVRRVSDPNNPTNSAYATLRRVALPGSGQHPDWSQVSIEIAAKSV